MIIAVSVCRPECGRSRETLQTALESCILWFRKCIFFNIFKIIVKSLQIHWNCWKWYIRDHYGARKYRNIENHRYVSKPLIKYPEESNSSNFELHRAKHKKSVPMQIIKRQFTSLTPCTSAQVQFRSGCDQDVGFLMILVLILMRKPVLRLPDDFPHLYTRF